MIVRSEKEGKDKTRRGSGTAISLNKVSSGAMALGSGTQAAVITGAMMEEGLGTGSVNGHGQGKLWSLDQNMDKPLGLKADRVHNMQYRKVREHS
jgi:saccharopine dehydrogenase-like NADP-dependent oxidoreductase